METKEDMLKLAASLKKEEILTLLREGIKKYDSSYSEKSKEDALNMVEFSCVLFMSKRLVPNADKLKEVTQDLRSMENMMKLIKPDESRRN